MDPKSGFKTTEFWTAVLGAIGLTVPALLAALGDRPWVATVLAAAGAALPAVYVWGRAILKTELARQTSLIPDAWEGTLGKALDVVEALAAALPKAAATTPGAASISEAGDVATAPTDATVDGTASGSLASSLQSPASSLGISRG